MKLQDHHNPSTGHGANVTSKKTHTANISLSAEQKEKKGITDESEDVHSEKWELEEVRVGIQDIANAFASGEIPDNLGKLDNFNRLLQESGWTSRSEKKELSKDLEIAISRANSTIHKLKEETEYQFTAEETRAGIELGLKPNLFIEFHHILELLGFPVQKRFSDSILLAHTSRLLPHSTAHLLYGSSSSGKSAIFFETLKMLLSNMYIVITSASQLALYQLGSLNGKILVFGEIKPQREGEDDHAQMSMRQLISENKLTRFVVERVDGKNQGAWQTTEGPCVLVSSTTCDPQAFNNELGNRAFWIPSDESAETTAAVLSKVCDHMRGERSSVNIDAKLKAWQAFNKSLEVLPVQVPYAREIMLKSKVVEARRLMKLLRDYINTSALLHQHSRKKVTLKDGLTYIQAQKEDYQTAVHLLSVNGPRTLDLCSGRSKTAFEEVHRKLEIEFADFFTISDLIKLLQKPRATVQGYLHQWCDIGLVKELDERHRKQKRYKTAESSSFSQQDLGIVPFDAVDWTSVDWSCSDVIELDPEDNSAEVPSDC